MEQALLAARDAGRVDLPLFELVMKQERVRLTSLDFPHRYADAYLRDSEVGGVGFDSSDVGRECGRRRRGMCGRCTGGSRTRCCMGRGTRISVGEVR
ncbi:hypothetical protein PSH25_003370 [Micromonospora sp. PSH25]|nr:hypothetical protein [Micromonospora foliorum]